MSCYFSQSGSELIRGQSSDRLRANEQIDAILENLFEHLISVGHLLVELDKLDDHRVCDFQSWKQAVEEGLEVLVRLGRVHLDQHVEEFVEVGPNDVYLRGGVEASHLCVLYVKRVLVVWIQQLLPRALFDFWVWKGDLASESTVLSQISFIVSKRGLE